MGGKLNPEEFGHIIVHGCAFGLVPRSHAQTAAKHRDSLGSAHYQSVPSKQAIGGHQGQIAEMTVSNGVDERSLDQSSQIIELADQPPARRNSGRMSGNRRVKILLVHEPVKVDHEIGGRVGATRHQAGSNEARKPGSTMAAVDLDHRVKSLEPFLSNDGLHRPFRSARPVADSTAPCSSIASGPSGPSWTRAHSGHMYSSRGHVGSGPRSRMSGNVSDPGTDPRLSTSSTRSERQARQAKRAVIGRHDIHTRGRHAGEAWLDPWAVGIHTITAPR